MKILAALILLNSQLAFAAELNAAEVDAAQVSSSQVSSSQVYKEVGEDGVPTFSDQAMPGAEPVKIREPVLFTEPNRLPLTDKSNGKAAEETRAPYTLLVTEPANESAIRNNAGNISLSISISPGLQENHQGELLMNGTKIRNLSGSGTIELLNLDRGTHAFSVQVVDKRGKVVETGPATSVSVLRYHKTG